MSTPTCGARRIGQPMEPATRTADEGDRMEPVKLLFAILLSAHHVQTLRAHEQWGRGWAPAQTIDLTRHSAAVSTRIGSGIVQLSLTEYSSIGGEAMEQVREVLTPEQAAEYLQIDRETIYRYIRQGKLVASKLGRAYRIPRRSIDLLLWTTRTRPDITLREYTGSEVAEFVDAGKLDEETRAIVDRFVRANRLSRPA